MKNHWLFRSVSPFLIFLVTSSISLFYCSMQCKLAFGFSSGIILTLRYFFNQKPIKIVHLQKIYFWEAEVRIFCGQTHGTQSFNSAFFSMQQRYKTDCSPACPIQALHCSTQTLIFLLPGDKLPHCKLILSFHQPNSLFFLCL